MISHFFNFQTKDIFGAAKILIFSTFLSGVLALFRDRLLAKKFGASSELDIYFVAFRIPDFLYGLLIISGISVVFLPLLAEYFKKSEKEGWLLVNVVLNCFFILLVIFSGILAIFTPWLIKFIAPGFDSDQRDLAISFTRIIFFSPIFFSLSSIFSGILHYFNRFLAYSLAPIFYNLGIIFGIIFLLPLFGIFGLVYGVILGAFLHWAIQIPAAKASGFYYLPVFQFRHPGLLKVFKFMTWRVINLAISHLNLIIITAIASTLTVGSITIFNLANNLAQFPINLIGLSFALAAFPALSRAWTKGAKEEFLKNFSLTFRQILFLIIPLSLLIFLFRREIVQLILGTGRFDWSEIQLTSASLGIFSLGTFAFSLIPFLLRLFFSLQDFKIPTFLSFLYLLLTIFNSFLFVWLLNLDGNFPKFIAKFLNLTNLENIQVLGLPLAISLAAIIYFSLLLLLLKKKIGDLRLGEIWLSLKKIILASLLMIFVVYFLPWPILAAFFGPFVYLLTTYFLRSPELKITNPIFSNRDL